MSKVKNKRFPLPFVLLLLALLLAFGVFWGGSKIASKIEVEEVKVVNKADGVYEGIAANDPVKVHVAVTIKDQKISDIKILEHTKGFGGKAEQPIITAILEKQSTQVDAVSGVTISSKTIAQAVANALK